MTRPPTIECIVMSAITSETKASGKVRKVTLLLTNDEPDHPFAGMVGERLHIIALNVQDDETTTPVALAGQGEDAGGDDRHVSRASPEPKERKRTPSQQAWLRCREPEFWRYLNATISPFIVRNAEDADRCLKTVWEIASKKDLDPFLWEKFENDYWAWQHDPRRSAA